ncbi:MAG: DUF3881 family protein [Lachnospiraceae bacterium]|nr:DUF3881 family protein [Lachnospiraceae bacterium]
MHKFMSAVGFHDCYSKHQLDDIIKDVIASPDEEMAVNDVFGRTLFQMNKRYAGALGVSVVGEFDKRRFRNILYAYPFLEGHRKLKVEEINIQKLAEKDAFAGIADDSNMSMAIIFYLLNIMPVIADITAQNNSEYHGIYLSSLALNGKILFGVEKNERQIKQEYNDIAFRNRLIREAKKGDELASSKLTLEDIDLYTKVSKRALKEDLYSIIDTTIMPYGVESDQYDILAYIDGVSTFHNDKTGELVYVLELSANDVTMSVGINERDLIGTPQVGRRFKGTVWMQGIVHNDMMDF